MKKQLLLCIALSACAASQAQELGRVISSTPMISQVALPRNVCTTEQVAAPGQKSGAGAMMGALAGGAMGNAVGDGGGRAVATLIGLVGGAMLGDRIEGAPTAQVQNVQRCSSQTIYENRTVGYNVVYEFAGKQYSVQLPQDPGSSIRLKVTPEVMALPPTVPISQTSIIEQPLSYRAPSVVLVPSVSLSYASGFYRQPRPHYRVALIDRDGHGARREHPGNWQ